MRFWIASEIALVGVLGTAVAGCGDEEVFTPRVADNERLISREAVARITKNGQALGDARVVGDIDGDGIDDSVVISTVTVPTDTVPSFRQQATAWVLYGGGPVAGTVDLTTLPGMTDLVDSALDATAVGDIDGDGLSDFLVRVGFLFACGTRQPVPDEAFSGAYLVYGRAARFADRRPISEIGVRLRNAVPCTDANIAGLGDLDGDGHDDFAILTEADAISDPGRMFVFYGRSERLSGVVDLDAGADAVITAISPTPRVEPVGDVNRDGRDDFMVEVRRGGPESEVRLVTGAATRLTGTVAAWDIASSLFADTHDCLIGAELGAALGDLDGDGADDFTLASCRGIPEAGGEQRVFYGRAAGFPPKIEPSAADATIEIGFPSWPELTHGDLDGDGLSDLVVGDPASNGGSGAVHIVLGNRARLSGSVDLSRSDITYVGTPTRIPDCRENSTDCMIQERAGDEVVVGEVTGDGELDLVVAAPAGLGIPVIDHTTFVMGHVYVLSPSL